MTVPLATAAERAGVTLRQAQHWVARGYLRPLAYAHPGNGVPISLPPAEADTLLWMGHLVAAGMRPEPAAPLARRLAAGKPARLGVLDLTPAAPRTKETR